MRVAVSVKRSAGKCIGAQPKVALNQSNANVVPKKSYRKRFFLGSLRQICGAEIGAFLIYEKYNLFLVNPRIVVINRLHALKKNGKFTH